MSIHEQMVKQIKAVMAAQGITQAELARRTGRTTKHVNKVFGGTAGSRELDYWMFCLGYRFVVMTERLTAPDDEADR